MAVRLVGGPTKKDGSVDKNEDCVFINSIKIRPVTDYTVIFDESGFENKLGTLVGGFENTGWTGGTFDTTHVRSGQYAYKISASTSNSEVLIYTTATHTLDSTNKTHIYYAQYWGYQETSPGTQSTQIYWPEEEPSMGQPILGTAGQWNMYSYYSDRSTNALAASMKIRIDFDNRQLESALWVDDFVLLDLTEIFGAGNEPSRDWCDTNIRTGVSTQTMTKDVASAIATRSSTNTIAYHSYKGWTTTARTSTSSWPSVMYTDGQTVTNIGTPGGVVVLYPVWEWDKFSVTLDQQSATTAGTSSVQATYGMAMPTITLPVRTGYDFGGYFTAVNGGGTQYYYADGSSAKNYDIFAATTLYAYWALATYTLTADAQGGSISATTGWTVDAQGGSATKSATYTTAVGALPTPTKEGYTFGGWYLDLLTMGYTPIEYIQTSTAGGECINTGYRWQSENIRVVCDAYAPSTGSAESLFGTEEYTAASGTERWFGGIPHGGNGVYAMYVGAGSVRAVTVGTTDRFVLEMATSTTKQLVVKVNGVTAFAASYTGSVQTSLAARAYDTSFEPSGGYGLFYIFSNHNSNRSTTQYAGTQFAKGMRLYSFKMYDDDVLVRDYIPVKNSSGVAGLFDLVNCEFVTTSSGTFEAGAEMHSLTLYQSMAVTASWVYNFTQGINIYAKWTPRTYSVTADASGGTISDGSGWSVASGGSTATKNVCFGSNLSSLPDVSRQGYAFSGWYLNLAKSGYTMLQYIESTSSGGEYINTDYYWHTQNVRVVADLMAPSTGSAESLFGSEEYVGTSSTRWFAGVAHGGNGAYSLYMGSSPAVAKVQLGTSERVVLDIAAEEGNSFSCRINGELSMGRVAFGDSITTGYANTTQSGSYGLIYIFANHNSYKSTTNYTPTQYAKNMRLYSFQMWDNGNLVRYFVPVKNSSGVAGLFDLVGDKFYTTPQGSFVAGPTGAFRITDATVLAAATSQTVYADWTANTYSINYNANGGSGTVASTSHTYDVTARLASNAFSRSGYVFAGWATSSTATAAQYTDGQSIKNLSATDGDVITLYAVWHILYEISLDSNLGQDEVLLIGGGSIVVDTQIQLSAFARGEYIFCYWLRDGQAFANNDTNTITVTVTSDAVYTAVFGEAGDEVVGLTLTSELRDGAGVVNYGAVYLTTCTIDDVEYAHFYAKPQPGYRFLCWRIGNGDETTYTDDVAIIPVSSIQSNVVTAVFAAIDFGNLNTELDNCG